MIARVLIVALLCGLVLCKLHVSKGKMSWYDGIDYCKKHKMVMAYPKDEGDFKSNFKPLRGIVWVGMHRCLSGKKEWCSVKFTADYAHWRRGEPNNYHGHENCAQVVNGLMNDNRCKRHFKVACR